MDLALYERTSILPYRNGADKSINSDEMLIALFLKNQRSKHTARSYFKSIEQFRESIAYKPLNSVTINDISVYKDSIENKERATQHNRLSALSSLYNFGVKLGYLDYNPFIVINKPNVSKDKAIDKFLTKDEVNLIWQELKKKPRNAAIGAIFITTGVRVSELCNIKCNHFFKDFCQNVGVHIVKGKGDKNRVIKIRSDVLKYILEYRRSIGKDLKIPSPENDSYLFLTRDGNRLDENYLRWLVQSICKKVGINKKVSPHWFRHTAASLSLANGCDIVKATENFGWSSLSVAKGYSHNIDKLNVTSVDYVDIDL